MLFRSRAPAFSITIASGALESIFDECDKYNTDETGGRLLGTYRQERSRTVIDVKGVIEPGPNAQRSPTYFLQDGEHQERQFRLIEVAHPEIEHLGNWHTHHVNGHPTLSGGDKATYFNTVNHEKHNTNFFYALLVVSKNRTGSLRYEIKHFVFRRNDKTVYEIPPDNVRIVTAAALWPPAPERSEMFISDQPTDASAPNPQRVKDQEFFGEFYPELKALFSKRVGAPYWKGSLSLIDGSHTNIVTMETADGSTPSYSITTSSKNPLFDDVLRRCQEKQFHSARHAVLHLERELNQALFRSKGR